MTDSPVEVHRRRVSYFMLVRLVLLSIALILLIAWNQWWNEDASQGLGLVEITLIVLYTLSLGFLLVLRRATHLQPLVLTQTGFDILLATAVLGLTGGVMSIFVFFYVMAILGAAMMGGRRLIWTTTGLCIALYLAIALGQWFGGLELVDEAGTKIEIVKADLVAAVLRNVAAMGLVATLSAYLNKQLLSVSSTYVSLRALNDNILRSLTSGLLTIDQRARVLSANPSARELLGVSGNLVGLDGEVLIPGLGEHLDDSGGLRNGFELSLRRAGDGREIELGLTSSALVDEHGHFLGHVVHFQDITELRKLERGLRRNERLSAIGELAASVAHEIRNPLAAVAGCAELLEGQVEGDENERLLRIIQRETARLANIVTELLDYTHPRALVRTEVDLRGDLGELAESFRADRSNAAIELVVTLPDQPVMALVDSAQISQVLWNLVRNAAQAMDGEGRLELGLTRTEANVELSVRDHGAGIAAADLERIFEPFFSTKASGSGIGLALVQRIIEAHGGQIEVHSTLGVGTQFVIRLPS